MKSCDLLIVTVILLFSAGTADAQKIKIRGSGKDYQGKEIKVFRLTDPVTKSLMPLLRSDCDSSGHFSFEIDIQPRQTLVLRTGIYYLSLYIDSVRDLVLKMPDFAGKNEEDEQNSFFTETKTVPEVMNDRGNINNLIKTFDTGYDKIFNSIADRVFYNTKRAEIPGLIENLNILITPGLPEFFNDFIRFRLIMLNQVANGEYPGRKEDSLIINTRFTPWNVACTDLIEQMFNKYFRYLSGTKLKDSLIHAISNSDLKELKNVIYLDKKATNEELEEYVIILNLYNEYFDPVIRGENILQLLEKIRSSGSGEYIKYLAGIVEEKLTALSAGTDPPALKLRDESGKLVSIRSLTGKYTLLSFGRSDNAFTVSEYGNLKTWITRFSEDLNMVTILRDRNYVPGAKRLNQMGFDWTILDGSNADLEEYLFGVSIYPSFMLLDRNGRIAINPCPFPSENLDKVLGKLISGEHY